MTNQIAADLRAAADVLERDGWTQGDFHKPDGCHCAMGAVALVAGFHYEIHPSEFCRGACAWGEDEDAQVRYESTVQAAETFLGISPLYDWNDQSDRTAAEVIAALRTAADRAEVQS